MQEWVLVQCQGKEWKKNSNEISLYIDLIDLSAKLYYFNMENDDNDLEKKLNLVSSEDWSTLNDLVSKYIS